MGIRYSAISGSVQCDPLRPKNFNGDIHDHLICKERLVNDYNDIFKKGTIIVEKWCCDNYCVFSVLNLIDFNDIDGGIRKVIESFKFKCLFIIYIVRNCDCELVRQLKENKYDDNAVIMTQKQYMSFMNPNDDNKDIVSTAILIQESIRPSKPTEHLDFSVYEAMRNNIAAIIRIHVGL